MSERMRYLWSRATGPAKVGPLFSALGALLTLLGLFRERGDLLGLVIISFATWGSSPGP